MLAIFEQILHLLQKPLNRINIKTIFIIFFLYLIFISLCSIAYGILLNLNNQIYDEELNIIFKNISFANGDLIYNLYYKNEYFTEFNNIKFYLQKTPGIPFLIYFLSYFSTNFFFIIIFKNLIIYSLYFYVAYQAIKSANKNGIFFIIISLIPIVIPYNFGVSLNFVYEDSLVSILLPCIFLSLITNYKNKYLILGFLFFVLYFVKTSMFFIIVLTPLLIVIFEKKSLKKFIPIFFSALAILTWGLYGLHKTDRFPILNTSSSINTFVMSYALNQNFHKYYPNKSTDLIPIDKIDTKNFKDEWQFFDFYKSKNDDYLKQNFDRYARDLLIKINFVFFGVKRDGAMPDQNGNFDNSVRLSQLISKIFLNLSICVLIFKLFSNMRKFIYDKKNIFFIFILIFNLMPHLVVWATSKHLIGIINVALIYLFFCLRENKGNNY